WVLPVQHREFGHALVCFPYVAVVLNIIEPNAVCADICTKYRTSDREAWERACSLAPSCVVARRNYVAQAHFFVSSLEQPAEFVQIVAVHDRWVSILFSLLQYAAKATFQLMIDSER